ncbi:MAG: hypothetical protein ACD_22C00041G0011 [uncultured bacterium]|nr:MAG: hypothetical protein ACD_22C00041G0011 [uncultured bacterium]
MKNFLLITLISFIILFTPWVFVYKSGINTLAVQSEDTLPAMFLPVTILKEGTFYIDTYYPMLLQKYPHPDDKSYTKGLTPFYLRKAGSHYISAFPVASGLLALPVYAAPVLLNMPITWNNLILLSHVSSALIMSFSGGFLYLLLKKHFSLSNKLIFTLTAIYLFGSVNFAMVSQALWQHGPVQLFTILGVYFLLNVYRPKTSSGVFKDLFFSGLFLGLAILSRPTAGISLAFLWLLILIPNLKNIRELFKQSFFYGLGVIPVAAFFLWYNQTFYLNIANQGYSNQLQNNWLGRFPEGFLGIWLSPSKGILIYSPIIIFSLVGFGLILKQVIKQKTWQKNLHYLTFALIVLVHVLVMGKWKHWYGGYSFGYRMASDIIPYLILLIVPYITSNLFAKTKKLFYILFGLSVCVELFGIVFFDGVWHAAYDKGFVDTRWLWSLKDSEFVFNIRRILVKLGILVKACPNCLPKS